MTNSIEITNNEMIIAQTLCDNSGMNVNATTFKLSYEMANRIGIDKGSFIEFVESEIERFKRIAHAERNASYVNVATGRRVANPNAPKRIVDESITKGDYINVNHPKLAGQKCVVVRVNGKTFTIEAPNGVQYRATKSMISKW